MSQMWALVSMMESPGVQDGVPGVQAEHHAVQDGSQPHVVKDGAVVSKMWALVSKVERHGVQDGRPGVQDEHHVVQDGTPRYPR